MTSSQPARLSLALALLLALFALFGSRASAQAQAGPRSAALTPSAGVEPPSLTLPRFELISGLALVHLSFPVGAIVTLAMGPPWFACGLDLFGDDTYDPEQAECEEEAARQSERAARLGLATGLAIGMLGAVLTIDGAIRVKRTRAERRRALLRPSAFGVEPGAQRTVGSVAWRF